MVASNRGPLSFRFADDGKLVTKRGGGGLVNTLGPALAGTGALWVSAAISDADRAAAAGGVLEAEGFRSLSLLVEADAYRRYYDIIANGVLWFVHHNLYDTPRRPRFDRHVREAWEAYRAVNELFADALAEQSGERATVLVHDYHLSLLGSLLAQRRPDLRTVHFHHTPFADAYGIRIVPDAMARELMEGLAGFRSCGFHSARWAHAFTSSCAEVLGPDRAPPTYVAPAAPDLDDLLAVAGGAACRAGLDSLEEVVGDRRLVVRVDRIEPSKNLLRGFHAFDLLLREHPEWRDRVVFAAFVYPSREVLPEYQAYRQETEALAAHINATWGTSDWTPIVLDTTDNFPRSVAGLRRYDVLLVNPVRDGLNLVAKEGPVVNERDGVLILSREAGVFDELGDDALVINPFDVAATADALHAALTMPADERRSRLAGLQAAAWRRRPRDWFDDQVRAAGN